MKAILLLLFTGVIRTITFAQVYKSYHLQKDRISIQLSEAINARLSFLKNKKGELIASGNANGDEPSFDVNKVSIPSDGKLEIKLKGNDGFVLVL